MHCIHIRIISPEQFSKCLNYADTSTWYMYTHDEVWQLVSCPHIHLSNTSSVNRLIKGTTSIESPGFRELFVHYLLLYVKKKSLLLSLHYFYQTELLLIITLKWNSPTMDLYNQQNTSLHSHVGQLYNRHLYNSILYRKNRCAVSIDSSVRFQDIIMKCVGE